MKTTRTRNTPRKSTKKPEAPSAELLSLDELKRFAVQTGVKAGAGRPYGCGCKALA